MATNFIQPGETMEITAGSAISSGDVVVVGSLVCVAATDIANGATGTVYTSGVFDLPKVDAAVIAQGEALTYDVSASKFDDGSAVAATGDITGSCVAWEALGATTGANIKVKINVGAGTVN